MRTQLLVFASVFFFAACKSHDTPHQPAPAPVPKPCVKDGCISLYTSKLDSCLTSIDTNNRGVYVQFPYGNLREPIIFNYERVEKNTKGEVLSTTPASKTLDSSSPRQWLFCTVNRDGSNDRTFNFLRRSCSSNRPGANTNCSTYDANEKWKPDDLWETPVISSVSVKKVKAVLDCPSLCKPGQTTALCRQLSVSTDFNWNEYGNLLKIIANPKSFPIAFEQMEKYLGVNLSSNIRSDPIELKSSRIFQQGPELLISQFATLNGAKQIVDLRLPTIFSAEHISSGGKISLKFEDPKARMSVAFRNNAPLTSLYGGKIQSIYLAENHLSFGTDKRCVAINR